MTPWGKHLMLNAHKCHARAIRSRPVIHQFSKTLVRAIDMTPYGEPIIEHFGEGNKSGYTLVQLISTSNITAHFVEETGDVYLDVFSCKDYEPATVEQVFYDFFHPVAIQTQVFDRQAHLR